MKSVVKTITILGIAASFSPLYSMMVENLGIPREAINETCYHLKKDDLKNINPFSDISKFPIYRGTKNDPNLTLIADCDSLSIDEEGLVSRLAVFRWFLGNSKENDQDFNEILAVLNQGGPIASNHRIDLRLEGKEFMIFLDQEKNTILEDVENFSKIMLMGESESFKDMQEKIDRPFKIDIFERPRNYRRKERQLITYGAEAMLYRKAIVQNPKICQLMLAVIKNEENRRDGLAFIRKELKKAEIYSEIPSKIPLDIVSLLCLFFSEDDDEERKILVEEGKQKVTAYCYLAQSYPK